jgi:hypothetical protein
MGVWMILFSAQDEWLNSHEGDTSKENLIFAVQPYTLALVDPILLVQILNMNSGQLIDLNNMRMALKKQKPHMSGAI